MKSRLLSQLVLAISLAWMASASGKTPFAIDDLYSLVDVAEPEFSADGEQIAYSVSEVNQEKDMYQSDLYLVSWQGKKQRLTNTPLFSEYHPKWSKDADKLAYLSDNTADQTSQIFIMDLATKHSQQISHWTGGVSDFVWSPDSRSFAFIAEAVPKIDPEKTTPPIEIDRFQFKDDERGYLSYKQHLYLLTVDDGQIRQLVSGEGEQWLPSWSPDGKWLAYVSKSGQDVDRSLNYDVFLIAPSGGEIKQVSHFTGADLEPYWESRPAWSPDSKRVAWLQSGEEKWIYYQPWQIVVADIATGQQWTPAHIDRCFYKPIWGADGKLYALLERSLNTYVVQIDVEQDKLKQLTAGSRFALDFSVAENGRIAVLESNDEQPFVLNSVEKTPRTLANHNEFLKQRQLAKTEEISFKASDGELIQGLLVKPANYDPKQIYPTIVRVHGGPVYQFSHEFMWDWQVYASAGYVVLAINPRGSSGRGFDFAKAIYADWGQIDVSDILQATDFVVEQGISDPTQLGIGGWSYGSILTNYVIASDTRFKAAVSGAGTSNVLGFYGHDQYTREYELELGTPWGNVDNYVKLSYPFLHADRIKTPTLFQCSALDYNVPCLGAEQMYQALSSLRVPSRLVIYPDQHHGISVPSYLTHRMQQNLVWYQQYLTPSHTLANKIK
jgi:dipeptidyl aminopeptidase/acylaminoacyl peptidase